jgi:hypothetical protein
MLNVALEEKFKIYEKTYGKKLEDVNSMRSLYAKNCLGELRGQLHLR